MDNLENLVDGLVLNSKSKENKYKLISLIDRSKVLGEETQVIKQLGNSLFREVNKRSLQNILNVKSGRFFIGNKIVYTVDTAECSIIVNMKYLGNTYCIKITGRDEDLFSGDIADAITNNAVKGMMNGKDIVEAYHEAIRVISGGFKPVFHIMMQRGMQWVLNKYVAMTASHAFSLDERAGKQRLEAVLGNALKDKEGKVNCSCSLSDGIDYYDLVVKNILIGNQFVNMFEQEAIETVLEQVIYRR